MNWEGKESRFGILTSSLFAVITTAASCGAVNAMHYSFTALGGLIPLWLIQLGEVVFGGVGSGLYGMLINVLLAVFIAGLMIGRTSEYLGKKIGVPEMKMAAIYILITPALVLLGTALAMMTDAGSAGMLNPGAHGFSEVLYVVSSAANNNDSAFAGLSANTPFWNVLLVVAMLLGSFAPFMPLMVIARSLAGRRNQPASPGTLLTHGALWRTALIASLYKFDPRVQFRNPVMFVVYLGSILKTCLAIAIASGQAGGPFGFTLAISVCSGSRSCSPTLLKRWRKGAVKRRRRVSEALNGPVGPKN